MLLCLCRYLVLDIADNPVENIIRFFPSVSYKVGFLLPVFHCSEMYDIYTMADILSFIFLLTD